MLLINLILESKHTLNEKTMIPAPIIHENLTKQFITTKPELTPYFQPNHPTTELILTSGLKQLNPTNQDQIATITLQALTEHPATLLLDVLYHYSQQDTPIIIQKQAYHIKYVKLKKILLKPKRHEYPQVVTIKFITPTIITTTNPPYINPHHQPTKNSPFIYLHEIIRAIKPYYKSLSHVKIPKNLEQTSNQIARIIHYNLAYQKKQAYHKGITGEIRLLLKPHPYSPIIYDLLQLARYIGIGTGITQGHGKIQLKYSNLARNETHQPPRPQLKTMKNKT